MFGNSRKKREAELRKKTDVYIPNLTEKDKNTIEAFKYSPHIVLEDAAITGNVAIVFELMCRGVHVMKEQSKIIGRAVQSGDKSKDVLKLMLQLGANCHQANAKFLENAINDDNQDAIKLLLAYESNVDSNCILAALEKDNKKLAIELINNIPSYNREHHIKTAYVDAIIDNNAKAVKWLSEEYNYVVNGSHRPDINDALLRTGRETLSVLGEKSLQRINKDKLAEEYIKQDKIDELHYLMEISNNGYDYDRMLSYAVQHQKYQLIPVLKSKGASITAQTIILDMLQSRRDWNRNGETEEEFKRRKRLCEHVEDLTKYNSRLLLYMIRNNKAKTVDYLLTRENKWDSEVIKDGLVFSAERGYMDIFKSLMMNSDKWDAKTYHKALSSTSVPRIADNIKKIRDEILGEGWQVEDDAVVRKEQVFRPIDDSGRQNTIRLTTIFNFKSCEVTRIVKSANDNKLSDTSYKNFSDYQNDAEINEAYNKLKRFAKNPVEFNGVAQKISSTPKRRIIRYIPKNNSNKPS